MALGSTQHLTVFPGGKGGRCVRLTTLQPSCAVVTKSGNLNFLEPSGPAQACNGTALTFTDKSVARTGSTQARNHIRDARDFNNIETQAVIKCFFFLQGKAPKEIHTILREALACFLSGRAKDLSAPL